MLKFLATTTVVFSGISIANMAEAGGDCQNAVRSERTACEEVLYQGFRDTSGVPITTFADHCDWVLRRTGEPITMRVVPRGHEAFSPAAVPLPRLTWAGENSAGEQFRELGLRADDGRVVVNTELCAGSGVWQASFRDAGVTIEQIVSGQYYIALCGEDWSHHLPPQRVLDAYNGVNSRGQFSVLSEAEGDEMERILTSMGY